jgi:tetratricopeptide (TPR) repeat protein
MLETIREYALMRLAGHGDKELWRQRQAEVMTTLAETMEKLLEGADSPPIFHRLESEHDNFRAALAFLLERGDGRLALRLGASLALFWRVRAHLGEGRMWLEAALATDADVPAAVRAKASSSAAIHLAQGDTQAARTLLAEALALQERTGDKEGRVFSYLALARTATHEGDVAEAADALRRALHLIEELDYREVHGYWLLGCAELASVRGEHLHAARLLGAADADFERLRLTRLQAGDRRMRETIETAALAALGRDAFLQAVLQGVEITDEQALPESVGAESIRVHPG